MQRKASRIIVVAFIIALASIGLVAATVYYFYTAQVTVNVEKPKVTWVTGSDIAATLGTNQTWCQITINNLEPNATTCYTSALSFTLGTTGSSTNGMALQIASVTDTNLIIWGIRLYVFTSGGSSSSLTLVNGASVTVGSTNGATNVSSVGYRQAGASVLYGSTAVPSVSNSFTGSASTTYTIVIEVIGKDGINTSMSATLGLMLQFS